MRPILLAVPVLAMLLTACGSPGGYGGGGEYGRRQQDHRPPPVSYGNSTQNPAPTGRAVTYYCEGLTKVEVIEGERSARVTLNSGQELTLARTGGAGTHFGAPPYSFQMVGNGGVFTASGRSWQCRVQ